MDQLTDVYKWTYSGSWSRSLVASYYYDGNGARAKTVEGSKTTEYVYSGHNPYCDKLNGTYTDYVYFNGRLKVKMVGSNNYWYIDDVLGSTRFVFKGTVKVYSVTTYKPFGIAYGASGAEKFTYAGEMQDSPSGLFYLMARYYDPNIGRFISLDPLLGSLSSPQTINRYPYCGNNPIILTDPSGMKFGKKQGIAADNNDMSIDECKKWQSDWNAANPEYVAWAESTYDTGGWSLEDIADVCFIAVGFIPVIGYASDVYFIAKDYLKGDTAALALDIACAAVPFGMSAMKVAKTAFKFVNKIDDVGKAVDKVSDAKKLIGRTGTFNELTALRKAAG